MIKALMLLVLMLSNLGYWELLRHKTKVDKYFYPSLTIVFQTGILFFAGLVNTLLLATALMQFFGIAVLLYYCIRERKIPLKEYLEPGYLAFAACIALFALALNGQLFVHYDNFSHWAVIVREMFKSDGFPNYESVGILFQNYPPGSASYIYYFCRFIAPFESIEMLAQSFMIVAMLLPLFSFVRGRKWLVALFFLFLVNFGDGHSGCGLRGCFGPDQELGDLLCTDPLADACRLCP